jgi:transcriptional regulator GlxA family with amidase domain
MPDRAERGGRIGIVRRVRIDIAIYEGFDELDAVGPFEVLRNAEMGGAPLKARLVVRQPTDLVTGSHGLRIMPEDTYSSGADLLVIPGGSWVSRKEIGAWGEVQQGDWLELIAAAGLAGTTLTAVCTGTLLLAHAGVIGSRRATTHHLAMADLAATGATVVTERVVDEGDLITAGGVTSGIDLGLWLVERFANRALADGIADAMEYPRARPTNAP